MFDFKSLYQERLLPEEANKKKVDSPQSKRKRPGNQRWLEGGRAGSLGTEHSGEVGDGSVLKLACGGGCAFS